MHEMEGPRRSCCPAFADRSASTGSAGLLRMIRVPIARDSHHTERVPRAVRRSRSLGSSSYAERRAPPTLLRSLGARLRETAPPRRALIAQDMSSWDGCPWCDLTIARRSTPRNPSPVLGNPLPATVSRCLPAPRKSPSGPVPVPGDKEISSGRTASPTRAFRQQFRRLSRSTGRSTGVDRLSPGNRAVVHCFIHRCIHSRPAARPPSGHGVDAILPSDRARSKWTGLRIVRHDANRSASVGRAANVHKWTGCRGTSRNARRSICWAQAGQSSR